jgi:hypothetical protein
VATHRVSAWLSTLSAAALVLFAPRTSASAGQFVSVSDDLQLYYEDVGEGPVMVWVRGWAATTCTSHIRSNTSRRIIGPPLPVATGTTHEPFHASRPDSGARLQRAPALRKRFADGANWLSKTVIV